MVPHPSLGIYIQVMINRRGRGMSVDTGKVFIINHIGTHWVTHIHTQRQTSMKVKWVYLGRGKAFMADGDKRG